MTLEQIKFRKYVIKAMETNNNDLIRSIIYMNTHCGKNDDQFRRLNKSLTAEEKNEVIRELLVMVK